MNVRLTQQFEIAFWDLVTQSLSQSRLVRYFVYHFYHLFHQQPPEKLILTFAWVGAAGFFTGAVLGALLILLQWGMK
ncbi:hypothetical protein ADN00_08045 [Ornatilinea apprima]|uniref:Uncharacterized protein n=1 Tax=Ornatilinea apprima TaxID=1134406 RepID=A0A0P6XC50_9CHLR|nr:hypothetical protein [Ornatilinea apprima]KPL77828.1 hypothetical protein ADN00_08045 [Ornatilinea apprima]